MPNTLIIGDIHGCYDELQALLDKAGLSDDDTIISVGDMVDRGPETPQVLNFFQTSPNARAVMGNHERKHLRGARHELRLSATQRITQAQLGSAYPQALAWMERLPLYLDLPEALVVHGYIEPGVALAEQNPAVLCGTMGGEKVLREGYPQPWYELYDGPKPVIVGHDNYTDTTQPFVFREQVFGLETGCVTGGALTGLLLPAFQFVSVPSRGNLWMPVKRAYQQMAPPAPARATITWDDADNLLLAVLYERVQVMSARILAEVEAQTGYAQLTSRQQAKRFAERAGHNGLAGLLSLARLGQLDMTRMQQVVRDPARLDALFADLQSMQS